MIVLVGEEGFHVHDVLWMWLEADKVFSFHPLLDGESPKSSHLAAPRPLYRVEEGEDWIGDLLDCGPSGASQQDGVIGAKDVVPVGAVVNHPRVLLALAVVGAFSYGGVWRDLCCGDSETGGGKHFLSGYDLGGASACDQVTAQVEVVLGGGTPRPEAHPGGLLADAARKGRLFEGGSGQEAHFGLALGAIASARVNEAFCVGLCNPFVLERQEKTLKRLHLR